MPTLLRGGVPDGDGSPSAAIGGDASVRRRGRTAHSTAPIAARRASQPRSTAKGGSPSAPRRPRPPPPGPAQPAMGSGGSTPAGAADAAAASLQAGLEASVDRVLMSEIAPMQKRALLCSAACCDTAKKPSDIQTCSAACDAPVQAAQAVVAAHVQDFQQRLGRAAQACADRARAGLPAEPSDKDAARARAKMDACVAAAAAEFESELPRLADRLTAEVKAKAGG